MPNQSSSNTRIPKSRPVVFLDRDGTLIEERNYLGDAAKVSLVPGCISALRSLQAHGFGLIMVTNQSGVGRGLITVEQVDEVNSRLEELLAEHDVLLDKIFVCIHHPDDNCQCRKPRDGMVVEASQIFDIDIAGSWVIGDKCSDVGLGDNIGARTVLIRPDEIEVDAEDCAATKVVSDFGSAASYVISRT